MSLRGSRAALALKRLEYRLRPQSPYSLTTDSGPMTIHHVDEYSQRWLYRSAGNLNHWHEPSLSWLLLLAGMRGATAFLDIGAHLGYFSLLHTARSGNTAYALELDPKNFEILEEISARSGSEHVRIFNNGAADAPGA
jgi:predicted O-methyltransferase YrrM